LRSAKGFGVDVRNTDLARMYFHDQPDLGLSSMTKHSMVEDDNLACQEKAHVCPLEVRWEPALPRRV
jgi:hypothetical protein